MIRFLFKGILRDRGRSLLPIVVVSIGVAVTVQMHCWISGIMGESVVMNANFSNGHLKVMSRAYAAESAQMPNDMALLGANELQIELRKKYPGLDWVNRIRFGGLIDFPDSTGETRAQGPAINWALDLFGKDSKEVERFNIRKAIVRGHFPEQPSEALISEDLALKLGVKPGDGFTLFGTTMEGSMAFKNFIVAGTVRFGVSAIDRGAIITDLEDARAALLMEDATSELLGYFSDGSYHDEEAKQIASEFNTQFIHSTDEYAPQMFTFRDQEGMDDLLNIVEMMSGIMIFVFIMAMSVVLWNTGLIGGLRRFSEFGLRLALGENKNHIYLSLIGEGVLVGLIGTVIGTMIGLGLSWIIQVVGIDVSGMMKNSSLMMPSVIRTHITSTAYYIGFIPGLVSMVLGSALAGIGIYKRKTAQLFKELEV